ncbi:hypothetical protein [uncultured Pseudoflavonifractor sp.]|uniref:hypothetical protein n=1 Tax=uncultured Pseudoflavonifractor sp. TaxID=1221379 RepID=UPI0025DABCA0|nr:hypothetical protein [uncultured Pseudoflavonifractor sp.]
MEGMFLPVLSHFQNENIWIASDGKLRYQVTPTTETGEDGTEKQVLIAETWEGPWSREFSVIEEVEEFPMTEDGIEDLRAWLILESLEINDRPDKSLEENMARREAAIQARKAAEDEKGKEN